MKYSPCIAKGKVGEGEALPGKDPNASCSDGNRDVNVTLNH